MPLNGFENYQIIRIVRMSFRWQNHCFVFSSMHLHVYLCWQLEDKGVCPSPVLYRCTAYMGAGAFVPARAGIHFLTGQWAELHWLRFEQQPQYTILCWPAYGGPVRINCNFIRDGIWPAAVHIQIDKRPDIPYFAKIVCCIVVICRIKAQVLDGNTVLSPVGIRVGIMTATVTMFSPLTIQLHTLCP